MKLFDGLFACTALAGDDYAYAAILDNYFVKAFTIGLFFVCYIRGAVIDCNFCDKFLEVGVYYILSCLIDDLIS